MRPLRSFPVDRIARARLVPLAQAVELLGYFSKIDPLFKPVKDKSTQRWHVSVGGRVIELLVTGERWYATAEKKGGGGAIDLVMMLDDCDFPTAVKRLTPAQRD